MIEKRISPAREREARRILQRLAIETQAAAIAADEIAFGATTGTIAKADTITRAERGREAAQSARGRVRDLARVLGIEH